MAQEASINDVLGTTDVLWNLKDLYASQDDPQVESDIQWCLEESARISRQYRNKVDTLNSVQLQRCVEQLEKLQTILGKLATFGFLNFTTQLENAEVSGFYQRIMELISQVEKDVVFFELEWNSIAEEKITQLLDAELLGGYRHYLNSMRRFAPHQLSEKEEKLLIERVPVGRSSWTTLFEKVIGHIRFGKDGRTEEEVLTDLYNPDREVRIQAATDLTKGLRSHEHILTHIFNTLAAEKMVTDRQRTYQNWVSSMNLENQVKDGTVESLIQSVTARYDIVERFYKLKARLLDLETLYDYDRYAPLPDLPTKQVPWDDCRDIVLESFANFSPKMAAIAEPFFSRNYIHAPVFSGKRGGAFAHPCIPEVHPYVMVNYTGSLRDISTVAHELGHGIHQVLASEVGYYNSDTPLVLAETASVFAELIVFKAQVDLLENTQQKRAFTCQKLESIFATVFRQTAMNRFEDGVHQRRRDAGELSSEQISEIWIKTQQAMFGSSVTLSENYSIWWSYIPHFLSTPGYVYSYAFGELLVLALYSIYEQEKDDFIDKYLTLLKAGGSATPYSLLAPFGIDLDNGEFWNKGLELIDRMMSDVE